MEQRPQIDKKGSAANYVSVTLNHLSSEMKRGGTNAEELKRRSQSMAQELEGCIDFGFGGVNSRAYKSGLYSPDHALYVCCCLPGILSYKDKSDYQKAQTAIAEAQKILTHGEQDFDIYYQRETAFGIIKNEVRSDIFPNLLMFSSRWAESSPTKKVLADIQNAAVAKQIVTTSGIRSIEEAIRSATEIPGGYSDLQPDVHPRLHTAPNAQNLLLISLDTLHSELQVCQTANTPLPANKSATSALLLARGLMGFRYRTEAQRRDQSDHLDQDVASHSVPEVYKQTVKA